MERIGLAQATFNSRIKIRTIADVRAQICANFPHYETIKRMTSLDPLNIHYFLLSQRLLLRDAHIDINQYCIKLSDVIYANTSERKRFKKGSPKTFIPNRESDSEDIFRRLPIKQDQIAAAIDAISPGRVKSCNNQIVARGKLIALVKLLNRELIASTEAAASRSPFDDNRLRLTVITDWINWIFQYKYGVKSTYTREQVRQMIKRKNVQGGRIELVPPPFEAEIPEFYRRQ